MWASHDLSRGPTFNIWKNAVILSEQNRMKIANYYISPFLFYIIVLQLFGIYNFNYA